MQSNLKIITTIILKNLGPVVFFGPRLNGNFLFIECVLAIETATSGVSKHNLKP